MPAYDAGESGGTPFLVYKWVEGRDLDTAVRNGGPLTLDKTLAYVIQAARGLEHSHANGVIHRDVKTSNLLLGENETVLVTDFGLACVSNRIEHFDDSMFRQESLPRDVKLLYGHGDGTSTCFEVQPSGPVSEDASLTRNGTFLGTPHFMAPEQSLTAHVDRRADIYGLGCSLFFLLYGRPPYGRKTIGEVISAHRCDPIPSLADNRHQPVSAIEPVFNRMMAKKVNDRYQEMGEVIDDIEQTLRSARNRSRIFISYRRSDALDAADRLYSKLALKLGKPIIPVLVGRSDMPAAEELPEPLHDLSYRNAAQLRAGREYESHLARLITDLERMLDSKAG